MELYSISCVIITDWFLYLQESPSSYRIILWFWTAIIKPTAHHGNDFGKGYHNRRRGICETWCQLHKNLEDQKYRWCVSCKLMCASLHHFMCFPLRDIFNNLHDFWIMSTSFLSASGNGWHMSYSTLINITEFSWYCALCNTCRPTSAVCLHTHNMGRVKISVHYGLVSATGIYQSKYDDLMCHHQVFKLFLKLLFSQSIFIVRTPLR